MRSFASPCTLFFLLLLFLLHQPTSAIKKSYVVYLGGHPHNELDLEGLHDRIKESHYDLLASFLGSRKHAKEAIFYSYTTHINGFAAILDHHHALHLAKHPSVISVFPNEGRKLHTTRSWTFMGVEKNGVIPSYSIWNKARFGQDTIIANLDTGAWPESKSFGDEGMGPIPSRWKGICQNDTGTIIGRVGIHCNRKLIGARYFNKGYLAALSTTNSTTNATTTNTTIYTPRDYDGHGTHTLSTAGGAFVPHASVFGRGEGTAKGGSPLARVATYKVCWPPINGNECFDADILAAFDAAIHDGVDVISASLGGDPTALFNDSLSIGSFHATMKGISVVCSAGNSGPANGTVSNVSPWMLTVGASTMDREFTNWVVMSNTMRFKGQSLAPKSLVAGKFYHIVSAAHARAANVSADQAILCKAGTLDRKKAKGKIVVCLRGGNSRVDKGEQVVLVGGVGMVLANDITTANELVADAHVLPASHINYTDGLALFALLNSTTKSPKASITQATTQLGTKPAPFMAAFSSKGPSTITPEILKPDVTAPGVSVIAAYTEAQGPTDQPFDKRRVQFNSISGTSMSCPHVSGIVGLLKTLYPHWSPAAIKSAIMTTASTIDNVKESILNSSNIKADPFSYGAGHVQPNQAMDPGLVYDLTIKDYLNFLCALGYNHSSIALFTGKTYACPNNNSNNSSSNTTSLTLSNLNYPSITVPNLSGSVTVARTAKNVGSPGTYVAHVASPHGVRVLVKPRQLVFKRIGEEKTYYVTMKVDNKKATKGSYVFGRLTWSDGMHHVTSPLVVKVV